MMNGGQQIVGGLLAYCFSLIKTGPLKSWQALFMTYGFLSILWGVFVLYWMPDSPMRAKCFTEEEKKLMVERVRSNQTGLQNKKFRAYQIREAFTDPQLYCHMLIAVSSDHKLMSCLTNQIHRYAQPYPPAASAHSTALSSQISASACSKPSSSPWSSAP